MIKDIEEGRIPKGFDYKEAGTAEWDQLQWLWNQTAFSSVKFTNEELPLMGICWRLHEEVGDFVFDMQRSVLTKERITNSNDLGLIGLSLINPKDTNVILTEGVSDYFTVKLNCPNTNVLGLTSLGGSVRARAILLNLFDKVLYIADNDEAGRSGAFKLKTYLEGYGKKVKIWTPTSPGCKDVTDVFMQNIRFQG